MFGKEELNLSYRYAIKYARNRCRAHYYFESDFNTKIE